MVLPLPILWNEYHAVRPRSAQFKFNVWGLPSKRVRDVEPTGRDFFKFGYRIRFRPGFKLMSCKELHAEVLAVRIPHDGNSSTFVDCVNLGGCTPFDKTSTKRSAVGNVVTEHCLASSVSKCHASPMDLAEAYSCHGLRLPTLGNHLYPKPTRSPSRSKANLPLVMLR